MDKHSPGPSPQDGPRFVSRLTRNTMALILAGGRGTRLHELTEWRAKPALPFGGKFRIIDFTLSNCANSGIRRVGVLTQYKSHSLIRHLISGWTHFRKETNEFIEVLPAQQRTSDDWYKGTADAVFQNLDIIRSVAPDYVVILAGDHVYKMDYGTMIAEHVRNEADMTVGCIPVPTEEAAGALGVMQVDEHDRILSFAEKPAQPAEIPGEPGKCLASMGIYVFNTRFLFEQLIRDADDSGSKHDFGFNIIPHVVPRYRCFAYSFRDEQLGIQYYWRDVGTLDGYWAANMELVDPVPELNIYDVDWPIRTAQNQLPPAKFVFDDDDRRGYAVDSMVSGGCIISGAKVKHSLIFNNVRIHSYATVEQAVILPECDIGRGCQLKKCIIDRGVFLPPDTRVGIDHDEDRRRGFRVSDKGVVLVTPTMMGQPLHTTR
ncbi:MAG: glucose-1-phosphate adenylyltransferase [Pseudomonadales bacterium]|nr:glucose-1-phosphate adenylyltransferase [Pseudomonadales bacterium]